MGFNLILLINGLWYDKIECFDVIIVVFFFILWYVVFVLKFYVVLLVCEMFNVWLKMD